MSVTIRDIAKACGVGVATVSRAINDSGYVKTDVKEKILACIREHHWNPSATATSLSTGKSGIIGILSPGMKFYVHHNLLEEIRSRLSHTQYSLMISLSPTPEEIHKFIAANVEAVLVFAPTQELSGELQKVIDAGIPVFGLIGHEQSFPSAHSNHYQAAYKGTKSLLDAGHRNIAYLGPWLTEDPGQQSMLTCFFNTTQGFLDAMKEAGIPVDENRDMIYYNTVFPCPKLKPLDDDLMHLRHTAYFVYTCHAQMLFYATCHRLKKRIPEDVSFFGLEGDYFAPALHPPPTHYLHNYEKFAELAMEFIHSGGKKPCGQHKVNYKLLPGKSIRKIKQQENS